jgi:flagellar hook assembly protein FlgD
MRFQSTFAVAVVLLGLAAPATVHADTTTAATGRTKTLAAAVAPATIPVITEPAPDASVSGSAVNISATSTAPTVRFAVGTAWTLDVDVVAGVATTTLDSYGLDTTQKSLVAYDCDTGACGDATAPVAFTVDNGPLTLTEPSTDPVGTSFIANATSLGGTVQFLLDDIEVANDTSAPYQATIAASAGPHTLRAVRCSADESMCQVETPEANITVQDTLTPVLDPASQSPFSPNGDGQFDTTSFNYTLDSLQDATWSVTNSSGATVRRPVTLGTPLAGNFVFNGKDNSGHMLPSGRYTVNLDTTKDVGGNTLHGHSQRAVDIDVTNPRGSNVKAVPFRFYPVQDSYRDATTLEADLSEDLSSLQVRIFDHAGNKIRTIPAGAESAGVKSINWDGLNPSGALVAAGRYSYRLVMRDMVGNTTVGRSYPVAVSHKKLVRKTGTKTVGPMASKTGTLIGSCSRVANPARPKWRGSFAYLSNYKGCFQPSSTDENAFTRHSVRLPVATKYGRVRVTTYGASDLPKYRDHGAVNYLNKRGLLSDHGAVLGRSKGWHSGDWVNGRNYVTKGRHFRWRAGATEGNYYDIRRFKVSYRYYVLR